ncbi:hypothetical protein JYT16_00615 [Gemmatimonas aurantiaca]|nr:hypothetical protein [Gemmatimonas aurantiaca]
MSYMSSGFFTSEFKRNLKRSPFSHLGALVMVSVLFGLFNMLWIGAKVADDYFDKLFAQLQVEVFFADSVSEKDFDAHIAELRENENIARVEIITKQAARERLRESLGRDYLLANDSNPLPRSATLSFERGFVSVAALDSLRSACLGWKGTLQISYDRLWLAETENNRTVIANALGFLLIVTLVGATLNAALLAGLVARSKTRHFNQLRMLGAGAWTLGMPLIIEGALLAALSAGLSWTVLLYAQRNWFDLDIEWAIPHIDEILLFSAAAAVVGGLGAALAARIALWRKG